MQGLAWLKAAGSVARSCRSDEEIVRQIFGPSTVEDFEKREFH